MNLQPIDPSIYPVDSQARKISSRILRHVNDRDVSEGEQRDFYNRLIQHDLNKWDEEIGRPFPFSLD